MSAPSKSRVAILHYTTSPVVGGVEAVILAHTRLLIAAGYPVTLITGRGAAESFPPQAGFALLPELDTLHPQVVEMSATLEAGEIPPNFESFSEKIYSLLAPLVSATDHLIVHNVLTKHFNLALTAALCRLLDDGVIEHAIAWCHDFTWTSSHSRSKVRPGYPWDLLRTYRDDLVYVTVSRERQRTLASLLDCPLETVKVIYNGVDPGELLGFSTEGARLIERLDLLSAGLRRWRHASGTAHGRHEAAWLNLLLPVRVTQAKNIEFAIQVLAAMKDRGCQARLVVTGPPDPHDGESMAYYESLLSLRDRLGVVDEVRFVYQSGPDPEEGYTIGSRVVGDLYRVSDALFMPSHREGFGMPVLEAGLAGLPVFCTAFPAAVEIGADQVHLIDLEQGAEVVAGQMVEVLERDPQYRLRRQVRQSYTWEAILQAELIPLLERLDP